ncbi:MAG: phosphate signaling complex protein PhoU [Chloroflexi bacterium]|jgi:phosphate transport system protein|nr:phosphate signaling complex protein PhoU [Chloroflexota bacterium]
MPRETLDSKLTQIKNEIYLLGSMVEQAVLDSVDTLRTRDLKEAKRIYDEDNIINEKRYALENAIIILLATQQPFARDLRLLAAMLLVVNELERMADYAKGIAKINIKIGKADIAIPVRDFQQMAEQGVSMLHRGLGAFIEQNPNLAAAIPQEDDIVDQLYNKVYRTAIEDAVMHPENIDQANNILWIGHNLERFADRVTNICERTLFITTGELMEMDSSDDENDSGGD